MSIQRVPLEAVQKIRQYLKTILIVPESENCPDRYTEQDEPPMPESLEELGSLFHFGISLEQTLQMPNRQGQWFISAANPGAALMKLPGLALKPGLRLVSYLYRLDNDGTGVTWAIPEQFSTTEYLEKALMSAGDACTALHDRNTPPKPEAALPNLMDAIEGDHSLMSFLIASLLYRELLEFGKVGRSASWNHQHLIKALPPHPNWQWCTEIPKDFSPKVRVVPDGRVAIEFFTCRTVAPIAIFQHVDQYQAGQYHPKSVDRAIALLRPTNGGVKH
ncbi:hypothetical protein H6F89_02010 [Cyanobacteria bacterium FACHB-63]|nr:hypothetical protein [Cyanobacteria bacterium FACHB-63]